MTERCGKFYNGDYRCNLFEGHFKGMMTGPRFGCVNRQQREGQASGR